LSFLQLLHLHLLADLLELTLSPCILALCDPGALIKQPLSDTLHVGVGLYHLGEVI
jgi:hypothetical protein